jgi:2-polyprenyl-3-methyl-5-hydroxy-6-metoxy-1,4-benzoquinol methylase
VVDVGCGTGKSLIWLAKRGFTGTGIDASPTAIRLARQNAEQEGVRCQWLQGSFPQDFSQEMLRPGTFQLAMERGLLQHFHHDRHGQRQFMQAVARLLAPGGYWYSLSASSNSNARFVGPPQWSATEIVQACEPYLEVRLLRESVFTPGEQGSIPAWLCVCQKP